MMMTEFCCPLENDEAWNPPEQSIRAGAYFGRDESEEPITEIKIPAAPCAFIRANFSINLEDMR